MFDHSDDYIASKVYSKVLYALEASWGTPVDWSPRGKRIEKVHDLVQRIVRNEVQRAIDETHIRLVRHIVWGLFPNTQEVIFVPPSRFEVNAGGVGEIALRSQRVFPQDSVD